MRESQRKIESPRRRGARGAGPGRQELGEEIAQIQRKAHCVRRAAGLMAILTALAVAGLCYPVIFLDNFPDYVPKSILNLVYALALGSLISLVAFASLGRVYRKKLHRWEESYRHLSSAKR